jgi:hypothetical protein
MLRTEWLEIGKKISAEGRITSAGITDSMSMRSVRLEEL